MSQVFWVKSASSLTINGGTCNAIIVAEPGSVVNANCNTINGEIWMSGTVNLSCQLVNGNINGGTPNEQWKIGKNVEYITGNVTKNV